MLLSIFRYYLDKSPRSWPRLVHICRKWRHIVFTSQQALHLRLFCSSGTPVSQTLDCWPPLPIVLEYGSSVALDPPSPEDEVNIIAALKRSDRVSSISLAVTTSLLNKLYAVERPLLELEDLVLLSRDNVPLTLPISFRWGPHLRRLHLTRIAFPAHLPLLHSSRNLVDLQLHEALNSLNPPIEELADALSGMVQLRSLSLHFPSTDYVPPPPLPPPDRPPPPTQPHRPITSRQPVLLPQHRRPSPSILLVPPYRSPSPDRHVVLPALTRLKFRGPAKYLDRLILNINAPRVEVIQVTVYNKVLNNLSKLGKFVDRIEMHKSHHQARILSSEHAISISLTRPGASTCFQFRLLSEQLSEQIFTMSRILSDFSAFLPNVDDLCISVTRSSRLEDSRGSDRWLELLNSFTGLKWLHLDVNNSTDIVHALQDMYLRPQPTSPPALYKLYLPQPGPRHAPLSEAIVSFMTSRWRSGHHIGVEYDRLCRINELDGGGTSLVCCLYTKY